MLHDAMDALDIEEYQANALLNKYNWDYASILTLFTEGNLEITKTEDSFQYINDHETCKICYSEVKDDEMVIINCGHYFCEDCWKGYLKSQINDGNIHITCMEPKCDNLIPKDILERLVSKELLEKYTNFCLNEYVEKYFII